MKMIRKAVSIICAMALMLSCFSASMFAFAATMDIAPDATASANSVKDPADNINDGAENTRWTAEDTHGGSTTGDWRVWLSWDETQSFDSLSILWEACYGKVYSIQKSDDGENWTKIMDMTCSGSGWQDVDLGGTHIAKHLGIFITEKDNTWGVAIWEIKVINSNVSTYDTVELGKALNVTQRTFGDTPVNNYGYAEEKWNDFVAAYQAAKAAYAACDNNAVGSVDGYATQAALDAVANAYYDAMSALAGTGTANENVMKNGIMYYDPATIGGWSNDINHFTLTDGAYENTQNNFQTDNAYSQGATVYINLAVASDMNKLNIYTESTGYNMIVYYTTATPAASLSGLEEIEWTELCNTSDDLKSSFTIKDSVSFYNFGFDTVEDVTAIKIVSNAGGWYKLREVEAFCDDSSDNCNTQVIKASSKVGDTYKYFAMTNLSEAAVAGKKVVAVCTITEEGTGRVGTKRIPVTAAFSSIKLGDALYMSGDFEGGHNGDYVTGVMLTGILEGDTVDVTFEITDRG